MLGRGGERDVTLDTIAGLAQRRPAIAAALTICMFSLLGFPGTFGFIGKWAILSSITAEHHQFLAVVLVLTSLVSAGYYLPVIRSLYMRPPLNAEIHDGVVLPGAARLTVAVGVILLLVLGILPRLAIDSADSGARSFAGTALDRAAQGRR